jgi:hypothetical protein
MALSMLFIILIIHSMILITKNNKVIAEQNLLCLRFLFLYQGASYSVLFLENKEILQGNKIGVYLTIVKDFFSIAYFKYISDVYCERKIFIYSIIFSCKQVTCGLYLYTKYIFGTIQ